ncbi:MAG: carboxypeptidase-like regulatory domain-containing protein, partial [Candidatus Hydrogenedens sp.]
MTKKFFKTSAFPNLWGKSVGISLILMFFSLVIIAEGNAQTSEVSIVQGVFGDAVGQNQYVPGSTINVNITFNKNTSETITALGLTCLLPAGWQYQGGTNQPPIAPQVGTASDGINPLEFGWIFVPSFPFKLSINVSIPSSAQGPAQIQSQALYRLTGGQLYSNTETFNFTSEYTGTPEGVPEGTVEGETTNTVQGVVVNSISKKPVAGVTVEISIADKQSTAPVVTDANGRFSFPNLGTLNPP